MRWCSECGREGEPWPPCRLFEHDRERCAANFRVCCPTAVGDAVPHRRDCRDSVERGPTAQEIERAAQARQAELAARVLAAIDVAELAIDDEESCGVVGRGH